MDLPVGSISILDYVAQNLDNEWIPLVVNVDPTKIREDGFPGKEVIMPAHPFPHTHFANNPTAEDIAKYQKNLPNCNTIAINTRKLCTLDVDTPESFLNLEEMKKDFPYYLSKAKKLPHFFYTTTKTQIGSKSYLKGNRKLELLHGTWAFADKNAVVHNAYKPILSLDDEETEPAEEWGAPKAPGGYAKVYDTTEEPTGWGNPLHEPTKLSPANMQTLIRKLAPSHQRSVVKKQITHGFTVSGKYCAIEKREHDSNNQYFFTRGKYLVQRCTDPECKDKETCFEMEKTVEIDRSVFTEFETKYFILNNPPTIIRVDDRGDFHQITLEQLKLIEEKKNPFKITDWVKDPYRRSHERLDFLPEPLVVPPNVYNTWKGYDARNMTARGGSADKFLRHYEILIPIKSQRDWYITWLATIIQQPAYHTEFAPVMCNGQGSGKNLPLDEMIMPIIGSQYYGVTAVPEQDIFGTHSPFVKNKTLIVVSDYEVGKLKSKSEPFKEWITGKFVTYNEKHKNPITVRNCMNFIFLSNKDGCVKLDCDNRRYGVMDCSNALVGDEAYFDDFVQYARKEENQLAVYEYLMAYDLTQVSLKATLPKGEMSTDMKFLSAPRELLFIKDHIMKKTAVEKTAVEKMVVVEKTAVDKMVDFDIKGKELYGAYTMWWQECGYKDYPCKNAVAFGIATKKIAGVTSVHERTGVQYKINLDLLRKELVKKGLMQETVDGKGKPLFV